jgi:hypothetical protein
MTSPNAGPQPAAVPGADAQVPPSVVGGAPATGADAEPVLPEQSREDTDAAWGEYRERDDDRLYRDRPPHWDDF